MTRSTGKRTFHIKNSRSPDPNVLPIIEWSEINRRCYLDFRVWLQTREYSPATIHTYLVGARFVLGFLKKPYWHIDPLGDTEKVWHYFLKNHPSSSKIESYRKGLNAFRHYLFEVQNRPVPSKQINWHYYMKGIPNVISSAITDYICHQRHNWGIDRQHKMTITLLSHLTHSLRWMALHWELMSISDITPQAWFSYLDFRIGCDISPSTLNIELKTIKGFLFFAQNFGMPICNSFFKIRLLHVETKFPKDVPDDELCILFLELEQEALSTNPKHQRLGLMDRAWFLLMLHSGLRSGEVRRLCLDDLDFQSRTIRINQSKGNKDRIVYFSQMVSDALTAFLEVRCSMRGLPDNVFIFRGKSLSQSYFGQRLRIYATRCDVLITPHQLRHTCATWLLNERVSIASVQKILGHQRVDITMRYARLYDATVAEDYSKAMKLIEGNPPS